MAAEPMAKKAISLSDARQYPLTNKLFPRITALDPYGRQASLDYGLTVRWVSWDQLNDEFGVEIRLTHEEAEMVERGRLANKVAADAKALSESIHAWLLNEKAR